MTFEGKWFTKTIADSKASKQYVEGIDALTRVRPVSSVCASIQKNHFVYECNDNKSNE